MKEIHRKKGAILKKEFVAYLKSNIHSASGTLYLTNNRVSLEINEAREKKAGILSFLFGKKNDARNVVFELDLSHIQLLRQGHYGLEKNVLEITDFRSRIYRVIVKNYAEWYGLLRKPCI